MRLTAETRRREEFFFAVAAIVAFVATGFAQTAKMPSLDEIIARHVQARGGAEKLKSLQSLRTVGTLSLGSRGEARLTREIKRPHQVRTDFALGGIILVHAYDGHSAWQTGPDGKVSELTGDDLKNAQEDADIEGPLIDYKQKGHTVEIVGMSSLGDTPCYQLKLTYANGDIAYLCLDAKTYLVVGQRVERNGQVQVEAVLGDYRTYGGIQFAGTSDIKQSSNPELIHYKLDKVEINPEIDDTRFRMPPPQEPQ